MNPARPALQIRHTAFESDLGDPIGESCLTDRSRLAIVLQAAALLSHLESSGWYMASSWGSLKVDRRGLLRGAQVAPGFDSKPAQSELLVLMEILFGARDRIPGKGQANRLADHFLRKWRRCLRSLPASRIVSELLDEVGFLWQPAFSTQRAALVAEMPISGTSLLSIAGRGDFERRLLKSSSDFDQLVDLVTSERARRLWEESSEGVSSPQTAKRLVRPIGKAALVAASVFQKRRSLSKREAAETWRGLADSRFRKGRLVAATKAASHAQRLAEGIDHEIADAALLALIEYRLRQGRVTDVEFLLSSPTPILESGQADGKTRLAELRARRDLVRGQPARACQGLKALLSRYEESCEQRYPVWRVLAARALGWLGEGADARELLEGMPVEELPGLDPEERPAIWALAGDWARARESACSGVPGTLWRLALAGDEVPDDVWESLSQLDSYRAARMVFDFQLLLPGRVPTLWLDRATQRFRAVGADSFAQRLDRGREGCWRALEQYLTAPSIGNSNLGELFEVAGYFDVRLEWRHEVKGEVLVSGRGGVEELTADRSEGRLKLSAGEMDPALKALFALAARDFRPPSVERLRGPSQVSGILGASDCLMRALDRLERLADTDLGVLIQGETGTGKELAARQLHRLSSRSSQTLVALNCAALSESLLLSDLFGHVRGAFTGADRDRAGVFEAAAGGSVLLDEIGDLPWAAQGKLLRVLQEGEVRRVGESLPRRVDVRVLAATHRNLESMVEEGTFRRDLFYRLKVSSLTLPPLRQREDDVLLLAEYFVSRSGHRLTRRARQRLLQHPWPGNVRELRNVLQVAVALSKDGVVDLSSLELPRHRHDKVLGYHAQVEELRCRLVREALAASDGHRASAARRLGVSRQALSYLVKRFDLERA